MSGSVTGLPWPVVLGLGLGVWAVVLGVLFLARSVRRPAPGPEQDAEPIHAVCITDAQPALPPARPDLGEYTDDVPASGAAWTVGPAPDENEGR